jgi:methylenetetrahydrofolate dehydrogenase (NADP+) / methenyltetrahydrofolate cyclohydrolase
MKLLEAKPVADKMKQDLSKRVESFTRRTGVKPKLAVVLVGDDPASVIYTSKKGKAAEALAMEHLTARFSEDASPFEVHQKIQELNQDPSVHGILIQRPLPKAFKEEEVLYWVTPEKDVDAFHPLNVGRLSLGLKEGFTPCTPAGVMEILKFYEIDIAGKNAVIIGRSAIVGKPMATLLLQNDATVMQCHRRTCALPEITHKADLLIVAAGKHHLIDKSFVKKGAIVIDVGIHRTPEGKVEGDVNPAGLEQVAAAYTPVPGGVGPMTIALLLSNTLRAAERLSRSI